MLYIVIEGWLFLIKFFKENPIMYQNSAKRNVVGAQENLISTVLYTTEASESSEISEKEINIPDPSEEVISEILDDIVSKKNLGVSQKKKQAKT